MGKGWMCLSDRCRNDDDDHTKRSKYRQLRERRKLADLCGIVGCLCEPDSDPRKNRYFRCGFQPWNCNTNDGCVGNGMADGFYERQTA